MTRAEQADNALTRAHANVSAAMETAREELRTRQAELEPAHLEYVQISLALQAIDQGLAISSTLNA